MEKRLEYVDVERQRTQDLVAKLEYQVREKEHEMELEKRNLSSKKEEHAAAVQAFKKERETVMAVSEKNKIKFNQDRDRAMQDIERVKAELAQQQKYLVIERSKYQVKERLRGDERMSTNEGINKVRTKQVYIK